MNTFRKVTAETSPKLRFVIKDKTTPNPMLSLCGSVLTRHVYLLKARAF
jgi:hypothetical protein